MHVTTNLPSQDERREENGNQEETVLGRPSQSWGGDEGYGTKTDDDQGRRT